MTRFWKLLLALATIQALSSCAGTGEPTESSSAALDECAPDDGSCVSDDEYECVSCDLCGGGASDESLAMCGSGIRRIKKEPPPPPPPPPQCWSGQSGDTCYSDSDCCSGSCFYANAFYGECQ